MQTYVVYGYGHGVSGKVMKVAEGVGLKRQKTRDKKLFGR